MVTAAPSPARNTLSVLDLFSGIGGISLGLERAGPFRTVAFCEALESRRKILKRHWPDTPIHDDVRTLDGRSFASSGERIDLICGGFPCQDLSLAGRGEGMEGARSGLWKEFARLIGEVRPGWVLIENVAALASPRRRLRFCECGWRGTKAKRACPACRRDLGDLAEGLVLAAGLGTVLGDLATLGYDAEWHCLQAYDLGGPHRRDRCYVLAWDASAHTGLGGCEKGKRDLSAGIAHVERGGGAASRHAADPQILLRPALLREQSERAVLRSWPHSYSDFLDRLDDVDAGLSGKLDNGTVGTVDQLSALGATVCVPIPEMIGNAIMIAEGMREPPADWDDMREAA